MKQIVNNLTTLSSRLTSSVDKSIKLINFLCIISIFIILLIFFLQYRRPKETYYAISPGGGKISMLPISEFNISPRSLLSWAMVATTNAYTLDFLNYEKSLNQVSEFFTKSGYEKFRKSIEESGRLKGIIDNKLIASAVVVDAPMILREGITSKNNYLWQIQIPIAISYQGPSLDVYQQWLAVTLLVKKVPTSEAKKGIGIEDITDSAMGPI